MWSPLGGKRSALDLEGNPGSHTLVICPADRKFLKRDCVSSYNSQSQCITRPAREKKPSLSLFMAHAQRRNLFGEVLMGQWPTKRDKKRHQWGRRWWAGGACNCSATLNALHQLTVRAVQIYLLLDHSQLKSPTTGSCVKRATWSAWICANRSRWSYSAICRPGCIFVTHQGTRLALRNDFAGQKVEKPKMKSRWKAKWKSKPISYSLISPRELQHNSVWLCFFNIVSQIGSTPT